jgi:hypothetical protein
MVERLRPHRHDDLGGLFGLSEHLPRRCEAVWWIDAASPSPAKHGIKVNAHRTCGLDEDGG